MAETIAQYRNRKKSMYPEKKCRVVKMLTVAALVEGKPVSQAEVWQFTEAQYKSALSNIPDRPGSGDELLLEWFNNFFAELKKQGGKKLCVNSITFK